MITVQILIADRSQRVRVWQMRLESDNMLRLDGNLSLAIHGRVLFSIGWVGLQKGH